jgi:hypothetical protein
MAAARSKKTEVSISVDQLRLKNLWNDTKSEWWSQLRSEKPARKLVVYFSELRVG